MNKTNIINKKLYLLISLYIIVNNSLNISILCRTSSVCFVCVRSCSVCGYSQREGKRATATTGGRSSKRQEEGTKGQQQHHQQQTPATPKAKRTDQKVKAKTTGRKKQNQQPPPTKNVVFLTQSQCV